MKALVAGALGIVGSNIANHLVDVGGWDVIGVARREPLRPVRCRLISLDLRDAAQCRDMLATEPGVTHLFYAARAPDDDPAVEARVNLQMLQNLIDPLDRSSPEFVHACVIHGTKWYGSHLGPYVTPAKEDHPRHLPPNFYFDQLDYLSERQTGRAWTWSTLRPHVVCGFSLGYPHNIIAVLGLYATICKTLGLPLRFPGTPKCFDAVCQMTDVGLLAKAMHWAATTAAASSQSFNVVNGDVFRWRNLWPRLAKYFGMQDGGVQTVSLTAVMRDKEDLWRAIVARHHLQPLAMHQIANWSYGDKTFHQDWDHISSSIKIRRFGFAECIDTEEMFLQQLQGFRSARIIP